jgi:ribosome-binding protein aMBF1 (putative translation factor)
MAVRCIMCGAASDEESIGVDVETGEIHCAKCDETYTADAVEKHRAAWGDLLAWIRQHPARQRQGEPSSAGRA